MTGLLAAAAANVAFAQTLDPHATTLSNAFGAGPLLVLPTVNGGRRDVALITRDAEGRYYADDATLADWRILPPYPAAVDIGGRSLRPLDGLPGLEVRLDERGMTAEIVVPPPLMLGTRRSLGESGGVVRPSAGVGAYFDYDVTFTDDSGAFDRGLAALFAPTVFTPRGSLSMSALYEGGVTPVAPSDAPWVRLDTTWVSDDVEHTRSLRVGDTITPYGTWARAVRVGGVQWGTNFATRPETITFPQPSIHGTAAVPSSLDIVVNGSLRSSTQVPSGSFQLDEIPVVTGAGQIQVVTRDLLGREQIVTQDFYVSDRLLKTGLNDYSVTVGAVRENYGIESNAYDEVLATGVFRRGLTDSLTVEGRIEGTSAERSLGASLARAMGRFGVTTAAVAISGGETSGTLWQIGHEYQGRVYRAALRLQQSHDFVQPGLESFPAFPRSQVIASVGRSFGAHGSLGLSYIDETFAPTDAQHDRQILGMSYSRSLSRRLVFWASASRVTADTKVSEIVVAVTRALGPRSSVSSLASSRSDGNSVRVDQRYELPAGPGFGYRTSLEAGDRQGGDVEFAVNTEHARYSAEASSRDGAQGWRVQTNGSIALLGGELFAAREISDGFAVVDTGGFEGVHVYLENREIGTTNSRGRLLVPSLRPYEGNHLRVESADLPLTVRVDNPALRVAPYYRSGTLASFGIMATVNALMRVIDRNGSALPEGAMARVDGGSLSFPVGLDGRLYVEGLHPGSEIEIAYGSEHCTIAVGAVPTSAESVPDLGDVVCESGAEPTAAPSSEGRGGL